MRSDAQGDEHDTVHHSTACRSRIEAEMSKDEVFSENLSDIENRKRGFLARKVEASDKERVDAEKTASGSVNLTETAMCTWIECASDKRTWAEVREEEQKRMGEDAGMLVSAFTGDSSSPARCQS